MNDFDKWNEIKKDIEEKKEVFIKEGDVWFCFVGKNVGREQNGIGDRFIRPVLVIKKFNNEIFWGIPLSSKQKALDFYYNFTDPKNNEVAAIIAQLRIFSAKRFARKIYKLDKTHFAAVQRLVASTVGVYKNEPLP